MTRHWPLLLLGLGLIVVVAGFFYDVVFAGIPYQDPTPEMSARYDFHARVAGTIESLGAAVVVIAAGGAMVRWFRTGSNSADAVIEGKRSSMNSNSPARGRDGGNGA